MEEYVIYKFNENGKKRYLETIYRTSLSTDEDINDALRFNDKETALKVKNYINARESSEFKVALIKTEYEDVEE